MRVVDYGDAAIPERANREGTVDLILEAQAAVEARVNDALAAGGVPIVIGRNSPCGSYAIAKPLSERTKGGVGMVSLDTHWDARKIDRSTMDPRIAAAGNWKDSVFRDLKYFHPRNLVEIGERGMLEFAEIVRPYIAAGAQFVASWRLRSEFGIEGTVRLLRKACDATQAVYATLILMSWVARVRPAVTFSASSPCRSGFPTTKSSAWPRRASLDAMPSPSSAYRRVRP
jgi:agmatinase